MKGYFHGEGVFKSFNGFVYTGEYILGKREGQGRFTLTNQT